MLHDHVRPSTLERDKRIATKIKKAQRVKHFRALELALRTANCMEYRHAERTLPS
jgi:hypothetical protein